MTDFVIKKLPYDLTSHSGLALVGKVLKQINLPALVDPKFPVRSGITNSDIIKSYLGLLCLGKNDFDAIEGLRTNAFAIRALGVQAVPSSPTLRQRLDAQGSTWFDLAEEINLALLRTRVAGAPIDFGLLPGGYAPLDLDTFCMDNGDTKKELVGRTYSGVDGYCPFVAYLGTHGYCLEFALRPGTQHSAAETEYNFERILPLAAKLTPAPLLVRADSGFCSKKLQQNISQQASALGRRIDYLIKWNPRTTPVEAIAAEKVGNANTPWAELRPGKRECVWTEVVNADPVTVAEADTVRRVYRLTERVIDRHGDALLFPDYLLEGWTTTLPASFAAADVIALYAEHATHEQFHSEFKSDMDLERLPSGKFDTNYLVCQLAAIALNLLRLIGQNTLHEPDAPLRHAAKRRRVKTVMQEMMFKAGRMIRHAGRWVLGLGQSDTGFAVFQRLYGQFSTA